MASHRIVIGGPPNSGKSTLAISLFCTLKEFGISVGLHEIDVYSDTHDCILGRKSWDERVKYETRPFYIVKAAIGRFAADQNDLVIGDMPGGLHRNPYMAHMVSPADSAIVVSSNERGLYEWESFFKRNDVPVILRLLSYIDKRPAYMSRNGTPNPLLIRGLKRVVRTDREIRDIAVHLLTALSFPLKEAV